MWKARLNLLGWKRMDLFRLSLNFVLKTRFQGRSEYPKVVCSYSWSPALCNVLHYISSHSLSEPLTVWTLIYLIILITWFFFQHANPEILWNHGWRLSPPSQHTYQVLRPGTSKKQPIWSSLLYNFFPEKISIFINQSWKEARTKPV